MNLPAAETLQKIPGRLPSLDVSQVKMKHRRLPFMDLFVGVTDSSWFRHLAARPDLEEVNFWRPSGKDFRALDTGELFLFKLHHPQNVIVGGGFFARSLILPVALAWDAFGQANGASTLIEVKARIGQYRHQPIGPLDNPSIGCILLAEPFFFPPEDWIEVPTDFAKNIVQGKTYRTDTEAGKQLYEQVADRLSRARDRPPRLLRLRRWCRRPDTVLPGRSLYAWARAPSGHS